MGNSVRCTGNIQCTTPLNAMASNINKYSLSYLCQLDSSPDSAYGCFQDGSQSFVVRNFSSMEIRIAGSLNGIDNNAFITSGTPIHFATAFDGSGITTSYINGIPFVTSSGLGKTNTQNTANTFFSNINLLDFRISDFAYWTGYTLTLQDVQALGAGASPFDIDNSVCSYLSMDGPSGQLIQVGDSGITNHGFGGSSFSINQITNGTRGGAIKYGAPIDYQPPGVGKAYISTTSGVIAFILKTNAQPYYNPTILADPTITISSGATSYDIDLHGRIHSTLDPWVLYAWDSGVPPGYDITYTAPSGWVKYFPLQTGYIQNLVGQDVFGYSDHVDLKWGFNIIGANYNLDFSTSVTRNLANRLFTDIWPTNVVFPSFHSDLLYSSITKISSAPGRPLWPTGVWKWCWQDHPVYNSVLTFFSNTQINDTPKYTNTTMSGIRYSQGTANITYRAGDTQDPRITLYINPQTASGIKISNVQVVMPGDNLDTADNIAPNQDMISQLSTSSGKYCPVVRVMDTCGTNGSQMCEIADLPHITGQLHYISPVNVPVALMCPYDHSITPSAYYSDFGWLDNNNLSFSPNTAIAFEAFCVNPHGLHSDQTVDVLTFQTLNLSGNGQSFALAPLNTFLGILYTSPSSFICYRGDVNRASTGICPFTLPYAVTGVFSFSINKLAGTAPFQTLMNFTANLSGCDFWMNIPHGLSPQASTFLAQEALRLLPPDRKVILEYTNEHWNFTFNQATTLSVLSNMLPGGGYSPHVPYVLRMRTHQDIWDDVFISGGRPGKIVRLLGDQFEGYNSFLYSQCIANNINVDATCVAPYQQIPGDPSISSAYYYHSIPVAHEIYRHHIWYNSVEVGFWQFLFDQMLQLGGHLNKNIALYFYEAGLAVPIPDSLPSGFYISADFFYHPEMRYTMHHYHQYGNRYGADLAAYYGLCGLPFYFGTTIQQYFTYISSNQPHGRGDGLDGKAINQFTMIDGKAHDDTNVCTAHEGWIEYLNECTGIPSYPSSPRVASETPSVNQLGVSGKPQIQMNFNKAVVPSSINLTLFDTNLNNYVAGTTITDFWNAKFVPTSNLSLGTKYTVQVSGLQSTVGIPQNNTFTYQFNIPSGPFLISFYPNDGSTVNIDTQVYGVFDENVQSGTISVTLTDVSGVNIPGSITYNSGISQFNFNYTPPLTFSDLYTVSVTGAINSGLAMSPTSWQFHTPVQPAFTILFPASGSTGNSTTTPVSAQFNTAMSGQSIQFTLKDNNGTSLPGTFNYNVATETVTYSGNVPLNTLSNYFPIVSGATDLYGNPVSTFSWSFQTTVGAAPFLTSFSPTGVVNINTPIFGIFNGPVQSGTIHPSLIDVSGVNVPGTVTYNSGIFQFNFNYTPPLTFSDTYTVNVTGTSNGSTMSPFSWQFSTTVKPSYTILSPASGSTGNSILSVVSAQFNTAVSGQSIYFLLIDTSGTSSPGNFTYNPVTEVVTYNNTFPLKPNTDYAPVITGVTDLYGNLVDSFTWPFQTSSGGGGGGGSNTKYKIYISDARTPVNIEVLVE